jgi:predicted small secreted protein
MVRKILASVLAGLSLVGALSTLVGCSVVEGTGRAMQRGGQEIQEEAREHGARP